MALDAGDVRIHSPCPVDLDGDNLRGQGRSWHCGHCDKPVHVLSAMTEREARAFLDAHDGQKICVSYAVSPTGAIRFRPEPPAVVPISALTRRRAAVAAIGFGVAMAACAPHDNPKVVPQPAATVIEPLPHDIVRPQIPSQPAPPPVAEPGDVMMEGEIPIDRQVDGGITAKAIRDEPCDAPAKPVMVRGGRG